MLDDTNDLAQWNLGGEGPWDETPWSIRTEHRPWMVELHRIGQRVAFFGQDPDRKQITEWTPTSRVFHVNYVCGTARYLGIQRNDEVEYLQLDVPIVFTGGEWQWYWHRAEPPEVRGA